MFSISEFAKEMAEMIFDDVIYNSLPHHIESDINNQKWRDWFDRQKGEPLMSYQGGASWDRAFDRLPEEWQNQYLEWIDRMDSEPEIDDRINEINRDVDSILIKMANDLSDEIAREVDND